jgi:hypothetical protein
MDAENFLGVTSFEIINVILLIGNLWFEVLYHSLKFSDHPFLSEVMIQCGIVQFHKLPLGFAILHCSFADLFLLRPEHQYWLIHVQKLVNRLLLVILGWLGVFAHL